MTFDKSATPQNASVAGGDGFDVEPIKNVGYAFSKGAGVNSFQPPVARIEQV